MKRRFYQVVTAFSLLWALDGVEAYAQETTTFTYDALGRVVGVQIGGGPGNGTSTAYQYDAAGNRINVNVSGSSNGSGSGSDPGSGASVGTTLYIVVPLNGFTIIPIRQ